MRAGRAGMPAPGGRGLVLSAPYAYISTCGVEGPHPHARTRQPSAPGPARGLNPTLHIYPVCAQVLLDVGSIQPDRVLLLDSYFYVVVFHGTTIAAWRKAEYHLLPEQVALKQLLEARGGPPRSPSVMLLQKATIWLLILAFRWRPRAQPARSPAQPAFACCHALLAAASRRVAALQRRRGAPGSRAGASAAARGAPWCGRPGPVMAGSENVSRPGIEGAAEWRAGRACHISLPYTLYPCRRAEPQGGRGGNPAPALPCAAPRGLRPERVAGAPAPAPVVFSATYFLRAHTSKSASAADAEAGAATDRAPRAR